MRCYTIPEAAEASGLTPREVRTRVDGGELRAIQRDGSRVIPAPELERAGLLGPGGESPPAQAEGTQLAIDALLAQLQADLDRQSSELRALERVAARTAATVAEERARLAAEAREARSQASWATERLRRLEAELSGESRDRPRTRALTALQGVESR